MMKIRLLKLDAVFGLALGFILLVLITVSDGDKIAVTWQKLMALPIFAITASTVLGLYVLSQIRKQHVTRTLFGTSCGIIVGALVILVNTQFEPSPAALFQFIAVFLPVSCIAIALTFISIKTEKLYSFTNPKTLTDVAKNWYIPKLQWWLAAIFSANAAIQYLHLNVALAIFTILIVPMQFMTADRIFQTPKWYTTARLMLCFVSLIAFIMTAT